MGALIHHDSQFFPPRRDTLDCMRRWGVAASLLVLLLWSVITVLLTLIPERRIEPELSFAAAKLGHLVLFGGWTLIVGITVAAWRGLPKLSLPLLWVVAVSFGAAIELLQTVLPFDRSGSPLDVVINAVGVTGACIVLRRLQKRHAVGDKPSAATQADRAAPPPGAD